MARICRLLLIAGLSLALAGCGGSGTAPRTVMPAARELPSLPDDGPYFSRQVSDITTQTGVERYDDINHKTDEPGARPMVGYPDRLTLDSTVVSPDGFVWAIWRFALTPESQITQFTITPAQSGQNKYFYAYADYAQQRWMYSSEVFGGTSVIPPDEAALHSPGQYAYIAILVAAEQIVNIAEIAMDATGPAPIYDIFDQFENNDTTQTAWPLGPGMYHASIHETLRLNMPAGEETDVWDFYKIHLLPGETLVYTMRFEPYDHFVAPPAANFNDLDVLFYLGETNFPLDDFIQANSSMRIYYDQFEQGSYANAAERDVILGVRGDINLVDPTDANAEYYLGVTIGTSFHTVSGTLKIGGLTPDRDLIAYLEPGNFNFVTAVPGNEGTPGDFTIPGVPNGTYTLKACITARYPPVYVYDFLEELPVTVDGGDVSGLSLDLGAIP